MFCHRDSALCLLEAFCRRPKFIFSMVVGKIARINNNFRGIDTKLLLIRGNQRYKARSERSLPEIASTKNSLYFAPIVQRTQSYYLKATHTATFDDTMRLSFFFIRCLLSIDYISRAVTSMS